MSVPVAVGGEPEVVDTLRTMLSNCATFQAIVQAASAAAALARIYAYGKSGAAARPFAVLECPEFRRKMIAGGTRDWYTTEGKLSISFEMDTNKTGTLTSQTSSSVFADSSLIALPTDFFKGLMFKPTAGVTKGESKEILAFNGTTGQITLVSGLTQQPGLVAYSIEPATVADANNFFFNWLNTIERELLALSGTGGSLSIKPAINDKGRSRNDKREDFFGANIELEFGT